METLLRTVLHEKEARSPQDAGVIYVIEHDAPVSEAATLMSEANVGCAVVMDHDRLVGILGEREILHAFAQRDPDAGSRRVDSLMAAQPVTVSPGATVEDALRLCTDRRVRHLPVIDGNELLGLLSIGDLVSFVIRDKEGTITELMDYIHGP